MTTPEATPRTWTLEQKRQWTAEQETRSAAQAAYSFLNMVRCSDCGLPWPEGYIHFECPALRAALDEESPAMTSPRSGTIAIEETFAAFLDAIDTGATDAEARDRIYNAALDWRTACEKAADAIEDERLARAMTGVVFMALEANRQPAAIIAQRYREDVP